MSQRKSGYKRRRNDSYQTPAWVTRVLVPHLKSSKRIWEPACGAGQMVRELRKHGHRVRGTDLITGTDFLVIGRAINVDAIVTNPPFGMERQFIEHALELMKPNKGMVAMLARIDYDSASTRQHLFKEHPAWAKKIVLTKRIIWFKKKGAAPSYNHCWLIWDWHHHRPATIAYGP